MKEELFELEDKFLTAWVALVELGVRRRDKRALKVAEHLMSKRDVREAVRMYREQQRQLSVEVGSRTR